MEGHYENYPVNGIVSTLVVLLVLVLPLLLLIRLRRNKKQTSVLNIGKYKRKKKDFNLTFRMFQTYIFTGGPYPLLIFRLN